MTDVKLDRKRLRELEDIELAFGSHDPDHTFCVMEAVAYVAGEPWTDHPKCASPTLTAFCMSWNDAMSDEARQRLKPYVRRLVGTSSTKAVVELRRSWLACDWLVRTFAPTWLHLAGLDDDAAALEKLPQITTEKQLKKAKVILDDARTRADAARAAAGNAPWVAAGAAAGAAPWVAAGAAARAAAGVVAGAAAGIAPWDAARAAARAAAGIALAPTVLALQVSAFELLDRMIAVT